LAKIDLKDGKKPEAVTTFLQLQRRFSGDNDILAAIGYAYLDNKMYQDVQNVLREMQKNNNKNPKNYVLEGDMLKAEQKIGDAAGKYDMALHFDPNYTPANIRVAEVYERINWHVAVERLNDILERYPDYTIPHRFLGKIYTANGRYLPAIESFKKYFAAGNYTLDDIGRYVTALYFSKNYEDANIMIKEGLSISPDHFVLNRLQMYVAANTQNIETGLEYAEHFFSLQKNQKENDYIALDYTTYAQLLKEVKRFDEAIEQLKKALLLDSNDVGIYKEMASMSNSKGESGVAADYYKTYIEKSDSEKIDVMDYFQLGRYYYGASTFRNATDTANMLSRYQDENFISAISENEPQKDSLRDNEQQFFEKALEYYMKQADKAFGKVIELVPDGYTGYMWKGRVNSLMDPETEMGLAKPYYEKVVEILEDREDKTDLINNALKEAYQYLGFYYYLQKDKTNIILFWNKVLEIDPENNNAKELLKTIK
jgi:tetratricopeptide (TPR) repeat protein